MSNRELSSSTSNQADTAQSYLPVTCETFQLPFEVREPSILISPSQLRQSMGQVHYLFELETGVVQRIEVDFGSALNLIPNLESLDELPLGFASLFHWQAFCIGPHTVFRMSENQLHVGQRAFNRFIEIDTKGQTARIVDPRVSDDFLSSTNWRNPKNGELWFASWRFRDTLRRIRDPEAPVEASVWKLEQEHAEPERIWSGNLGDFLHQVSVSPTGRYLILCEMGMRPATRVPSGHPGNNPAEWTTFQERGMMPSHVLVLDLWGGCEWHLVLPTATAAHVEFDAEEPDTCYISCHNTGMVNGANTLFGTGVLYRYRLASTGPTNTGTFTCPGFYRITSHQFFRHRDLSLIAVTGFPDKVFFIDARKMLIHQTVTLFDGPKIDTQTRPHFCQQDPRSPYGLACSEDGELVYVTGSGVLFIIEVTTGKLKQAPLSFHKNPDNEAVAGHLTLFHTD